MEGERRRAQPADADKAGEVANVDERAQAARQVRHPARAGVVAVAAAKKELVVDPRAARLDLAHGAEQSIGGAALEVGLDLGERSQRIVLAGEDQHPVGIVALGRHAQARQDQLDVRPAAPLHLDPILDDLAARAGDLTRAERRVTRVVGHQHPRARPLG